MERAGFIRARNLIRKAALNIAEKDAEEQCEHCGKQVKGADEQQWQQLQSYVQSMGGELGNLEITDEGEVAAKLQMPIPEDASFRDCYGWSLLHFAAERRAPEALHRLLQMRCDPNAFDCIGRTPLHVATLHDDSESVLELLHYGANPNARDSLGWTPVHFAIHLHCCKALSALLSFAPDLTVLNDAQKSPKEYAHDGDILTLLSNHEKHQKDHDLIHDSVDTEDTSFAGRKNSEESFSLFPIKG